jgi:hypothetical protein
MIYVLSGAAGFAVGGVKLVRKPCRAVGLTRVSRVRLRTDPRRRPPDFAPLSEAPGGYVGQAVSKRW